MHAEPPPYTQLFCKLLMPASDRTEVGAVFNTQAVRAPRLSELAPNLTYCEIATRAAAFTYSMRGPARVGLITVFVKHCTVVATCAEVDRQPPQSATGPASNARPVSQFRDGHPQIRCQIVRFDTIVANQHVQHVPLSVRKAAGSDDHVDLSAESSMEPSHVTSDMRTQKPMQSLLFRDAIVC